MPDATGLLARMRRRLNNRLVLGACVWPALQQIVLATSFRDNSPMMIPNNPINSMALGLLVSIYISIHCLQG